MKHLVRFINPRRIFGFSLGFCTNLFRSAMTVLYTNIHYKITIFWVKMVCPPM